MIYMIFEISCSILKKKIFHFHFFKTVIYGYFGFLAKNTPKFLRVEKKPVKIINLPYYLSHFIEKKSTFQR